MSLKYSVLPNKTLGVQTCNDFFQFLLENNLGYSSLEVFGKYSHFHRSLTFLGKAGAYQSGAP